MPKPSIFKVEPVPEHEIPQDLPNPGGVLADVGQFVKSSIDKTVQSIKKLVSPGSSDVYETSYGVPPSSYDVPKTYSLGNF